MDIYLTLENLFIGLWGWRKVYFWLVCSILQPEFHTNTKCWNNIIVRAVISIFLLGYSHHLQWETVLCHKFIPLHFIWTVFNWLLLWRNKDFLSSLTHNCQIQAVRSRILTNFPNFSICVFCGFPYQMPKSFHGLKISIGHTCVLIWFTFWFWAVDQVFHEAFWKTEVSVEQTRAGHFL